MDNFIIYDTLDSTNKEAQRLLAQGLISNHQAILARHQTEGKGQYGRTWFAQEGNHLAMTLVHQPDESSPTQLPLISMKVSMGVVNALKKLEPGIQPLIKWPNDIFVGHKKLCGTLIENVLSGSKIQHSIIGIGININETDFPDDIPNAVSLRMMTGKMYDVVEVARSVRTFIVAMLEGESIFSKAAYDHSLFGKGEKFDFESDGQPMRAEVIGVSRDGQLILRTEDMHIKSYFTHEIKWVI